ncbi:hypothetical protein [Paraglaciecola marina]|uniref:hypothetical protein n=1 Tax=Paraglaciecola marina TaxID=2500157 RepID=UPI00105C333F|nr:hypothetical protein [Paraglaciecola marina]
MDSLNMSGIKSVLNKTPTLRRLLIPGPSVALCSMGGVGSTALARHIGSIADKTIREHAYSPSVYHNENQIKLGYVFGNPYNSVLSVFRRGYQDMHCKAMNANSGDKPVSLKGVELIDYLNAGVDQFGLDRQLSNWLNPGLAKHPTILIKYEELADNIDEVLDFFDCEKPFDVKTRTSSWKSQPAPIVNGLESLYGDFYQKVQDMPAITILNAKEEVLQSVKSNHE